MYGYIRKDGLYVVGFFSPLGEFHEDSTQVSRTEARDRVHYLNGGSRHDNPVPSPVTATVIQAKRPYHKKPKLAHDGKVEERHEVIAEAYALKGDNGIIKLPKPKRPTMPKPEAPEQPSEPKAKKKMGRPFGSKNKTKSETVTVSEPKIRKYYGRKKGSKNKPKGEQS